MKVVVDTNVLVAGLLSPFGSPGEVVRMIASGSLSLCFDARIITEYAQVLSRPKFSFGQDHIEVLLDQVKAAGVVAAADPLSTHLPDESDEPFLEVAVSGQAKCLITGNLKHYPVPLRQGVQVLSPTEFLDFYRRARPTRKQSR